MGFFFFSFCFSLSLPNTHTHSLTPPPTYPLPPVEMKAALSVTDPAAANALTHAEVAKKLKSVAMEKAEAAYLALEESIMAQLGVKREDLEDSKASTLTLKTPNTGGGGALKIK